MFDCGEGTQKQFLLARMGFNREMRILISHMHADHVLGLPGLLHSMSFMGRTRELQIFGPQGIREFVRCTSESVKFRPMFPIETLEVHPGTIAKTRDYVLNAAWADHSVPCLAYALIENDRPGRFYPTKARRLQIPKGPLWKSLQTGKPVRVDGKRILPLQVVGPPRKGLKITYAADTRPCERVLRLASHSDLLVHDGMFASADLNRAKDYGHSTAAEAARVAKKSDSGILALIHSSSIYDDTKPLLFEARKVFRRTLLPEDLSSVELHY